MLEKSQKQHRLFLSVKLLFQSPNLNYPERDTLTPYTNVIVFKFYERENEWLE